MGKNRRAQQITRFWRAVEMFSPQGVPRIARGGADRSGLVLDLGRTDLAPWQAGHPLREAGPRRGKTWQFTVYGGLYDIASARSALVSAFGEDDKPEDARGGGGLTALFAFTVDADGCLLPDSATLSACGWAISRLQEPGPDDPLWLDGFDEHEREFVTALNTLVPPKLRSTATNDGVLKGAGTVIARQARNAVGDAVTAGLQEGGAAVGVTVAGAVGSFAGPVAGGIAGKAAAAFATSFLTPGSAGNPATSSGAARMTVPQLRLTAPPLHEFVAVLGIALDVMDTLRPQGVRVHCVQIPERESDAVAEQTFLNSFIANDLAQIEGAVRDGDIGPALRDYLADIDDIPVRRRIDVRSNRNTVVATVAPNRIPGGRWPAAVSKPLVISQQFAVNQLVQELRDGGGVFAVNGPPGTGKTTMLRDVLADVVVERAGRLADLDKPENAFIGEIERVPLGKTYRPAVYRIRPELTGSEVVVATASNDAAANVTAEIPGIDAVRGCEKDALAVDYFTELGSHVLGEQAWGLVTAVLGNMKNRSAFAGRFWFGPGTSQESDEPALRGMMKILQEASADPTSVPAWDEAVTAFRDATSDVRRLAEIRQQAADAIAELPTRHAEVESATEKVQAAAAVCEQLRQALVEAGEEFDAAKADLREAEEELRLHGEHKPGFWVSLSTWFRAGREWYRQSVALAGRRAEAKRRVDEVAKLTAKHKSEHSAQILVRRQHEIALGDARHRLDGVRTRVDEARERWPATVPAGDHLADDEPFQLCAPWADEEYTVARNTLFLQSLRLHKAFLLNAARQMRGNLAVIAAAIRGRVPMAPETLLTAWQSLFLVVPMVSTTFASLPRLFNGLGRESFGWLFIDEAGQATPQQAAGGLWRSRRAVIVGDPQQLEPIVTLPATAQHAMRRYFEVSEEWTPDSTSVQRVADRLAVHGTMLPEPDLESEVWVGAPLRVHRRCDRPMFEISNIIAYGGDLMVYGTKVAGDFPGANAWLDVRGSRSNGNWVLAEGDALVDLLSELDGQGVDLREVRVISPFRDVVRGCKDAGRSLGFPEKNIGTVHTVQGQESDVIVLVLGSAPRNARAREWAAEKPNLLNVAASRAKRRLYVIGDRSKWQGLPYFRELARRIPPR